MFHVTRSEQFVIYYWTGSDWSTKAANAKSFNSEAEAHAEMKELGVVYAYNVLSDPAR